MNGIIEYKEGYRIGSCIFLNEIEPKIYLATTINRYKTVVRRALFRCSCGVEFESTIRDVKRGQVKSCGCLKAKTSSKNGFKKKHGQWHNPIYTIWNSMKQRCENIKEKAYCNYGGRGIKVCKRWQDVDNFIKDMYPTYVEGLQIDRINNDGDYEPSNCKWSTKKQNVNNKRDNKIIEYNGIRKTMSEWAEYYNIPYKTFVSRVTLWKLEDVFTTPYPIRGNKYNSKRLIRMTT